MNVLGGGSHHRQITVAMNRKLLPLTLFLPLTFPSSLDLSLISGLFSPYPHFNRAFPQARGYENFVLWRATHFCKSINRENCFGFELAEGLTALGQDLHFDEV